MVQATGSNGGLITHSSMADSGAVVLDESQAVRQAKKTKDKKQMKNRCRLITVHFTLKKLCQMTTNQVRPMMVRQIKTAADPISLARPESS